MSNITSHDSFRTYASFCQYSMLGLISLRRNVKWPKICLQEVMWELCEHIWSTYHFNNNALTMMPITHSPAGYEGWFTLTTAAARGSHSSRKQIVCKGTETTSARSWSGFDPRPAATALLKQYNLTKHVQCFSLLSDVTAATCRSGVRIFVGWKEMFSQTLGGE